MYNGIPGTASLSPVIAQSCPTLCDPMDCSLSGSSVHGIFQARVLEWIAIAFSRGIFPTQESNLHLLQLLHCRRCIALQADSLPAEPTGKLPFKRLAEKKEKKRQRKT